MVKQKIKFLMEAEIEIYPEGYVKEDKFTKSDMIRFEFSRLGSMLKINSIKTEEDVKIERAKNYATFVHASQKYGEEAFTYHLEDVVKVLRQFGYDSDDSGPLFSAAWLHDSVEDCSISIAEIESLFGKDVAELVWRVTNEAGGNRKERAQKTYTKIAGNQDAIVLKLADRIANTEASIKNNDTLFKMYLKEWPCFQASLRIAGHAEPMWNFLETLYNTGVLK